jgi:hypothetical protein
MLDFNYASSSRAQDIQDDWQEERKGIRGGRNKDRGADSGNVKVFRDTSKQNSRTEGLPPSRGSFRPNDQQSPVLQDCATLSAPSDQSPDGQTRRFQPPPGFGRLTADVPQQSSNTSVDSFTRPVRPVPAAEPSRIVFASPFTPLHMPTPAETHALAQTANAQRSSPLLKGESHIVKTIEKMLGSSEDLIIQFKNLTHQFKENIIDAKSLLDGIVILAFKNRDSGEKNTLTLLGKVWTHLADSLPEESDVSVELTTVISKKKKKGVSLAEFEAIKKGAPKKDAMLRAWYDFKVSVIFI